jgi:hypothetical protein
MEFAFPKRVNRVTVSELMIATNAVHIRGNCHARFLWMAMGGTLDGGLVTLEKVKVRHYRSGPDAAGPAAD